MEIIRRIRVANGWQYVCRHRSSETATDMEVAIFLPPQAEQGPVPTLYYLSGLTCTWANVCEKGGAQQAAAKAGLALVMPDTSPRGLDLPGEHESYDFGSGAGFYLDATREPWKQHYRMYSYVSRELPETLSHSFPALDHSRCGITGHSMGGHGALVLAFRNPGQYRSCSAFAPICAPASCPWGHKAFTNYLGAEQEAWQAYDASILATTTGFRSRLLVDQGLADDFLSEQLRPEILEDACNTAGLPLTLRRHPHYDHSYYFIASFMPDHVAHHAAILHDAS